MKSIVILIPVILIIIAAQSQSIYSRTFGNPKDKPVIFLHGGPGYNCALFEATTAKKLSENGLYVIVYDRRGEGRSKNAPAKFNFQETFDDLNIIYKEHHLTKATLLGHSFGGVIATLYSDKYPENVSQIILIGAPVSLQETFKTIIKSSKVLYETKKDTTNLNYIAMLENMDKNSIEYSSYCFVHAMQNGFYSARKMTEEAKVLYITLRNDTLVKNYAAQMSYEAPLGFWQNEKYTTIDLTSTIKHLRSKTAIYGIYGKDDGLYGSEQIESLKSLIGKENVKYFDNCSHNVFSDQQAAFIDVLKIWVK